jgi:hypothetical protein
MKKNNKIKLASLWILAIIIIMPNVMALSHPLSIFDVLNVNQPIAPGTNYSGECTPWEIKGEYCNGEVRHYTQCQLTASGGLWQPHSEICTDYGSGVTCLAGKCVKSSNVFLSVSLGILALSGAGLLIFILVKKIKNSKKHKRKK